MALRKIFLRGGLELHGRGGSGTAGQQGGERGLSGRPQQLLPGRGQVPRRLLSPQEASYLRGLSCWLLLLLKYFLCFYFELNYVFTTEVNIPPAAALSRVQSVVEEQYLFNLLHICRFPGSGYSPAL